MISWLTKPAPNGTFPRLLFGASSAAIMFSLAWFLEWAAGKTNDEGVAQAVSIFLSTSALCILIPLFLRLREVPNLIETVSFQIAMGVVMGGMLFMANFLFRHSKQNGIYVPPPIPGPRSAAM
jgi:hypothetical protein